MRSFRNLQFARVQQAAASTFVALTFMLVLLGSMFSVSAFAQAPSAFAKPTIRTHAVQTIPEAGCFPSGTLWTWTDQGHNPPLQAWISNMEFDSTYGWHYNYHTQHYCGSDFHNYHIYYDPSDPNYYVWRVYDSVANIEKVYKYERGCGCSGNFPPIAADVTAPQFANDAANAVGDNNLYNASVSVLTQAFLALGVKSGDH